MTQASSEKNAFEHVQNVRSLRNVASTLCARWDIFQLPCIQSLPTFDLDSYILQYPKSLLTDSEDPDQAVHPRSLPSGPSLSTYV